VELDALSVRLLGDASSYVSSLQQANASTSQFAGQMESASGSIQGLTGQLQSWGQGALGIIGQLGIALGGLGIAKQAVALAASAEDMTVSFGVMLGSAEQGAQMVRDLQELAAKTPYELPSLLSATKMLLTYGVAADKILPTLNQLGDITGGDADKLSHLSYAFAQASGLGRLMGGDLRQMVNAGFNPLQEMARTSGKSIGYFQDQMRKGHVSMAMVNEAFRTASSEGGKFFQHMAKRSQTLTGLFSTMRDDIGAVMRSLGAELTEDLRLKDLVRGVSAAAQGITDFFRGLPQGVKEAGSVILALGGMLTGLSVAWLILGPAIAATLSTAAGAVALILSPLGLAIGLAGALFAVWVDQAGGLTGVWEQIRAAALAAWDWLFPVRQALSSFFDTVREAGIKAWAWFEDAVVKIWENITASSFVNWDVIRTHIVAAIQGAEWVVANFGEIAGVTWDAIKEGADYAATSLVTFGGHVRTVWNLTVSWLGDFIRENRTLLFNLAALTAGVLATYKAIQIITFGLGLVQSVMAFLKVEQIASAALWVGWTAAVLAAKAVLFLFNLQMAAWNTVALAAAVIEGMLITETTAATVATWLWNTALAALAAVAAPVELLAMAVAVGLVASALAVAGAAAWAAYKSVGSVLEALLVLPMTTGPLGAIGGLFREWKGLIIDIARAAQNNLPLAWQLAGAGFKLAVAQVQDLWPPLWTFIQSGFAALWDLVTQQFVIRFRQALFTISGHLVDFLTSGPVAAVMPGAALEATVIAPALKAAGETYNAAANASLKAAQDRLNAAAGMFSVVESAETKAAREEVERLRKLVGTPLEIPQPDVPTMPPVPGPDLNKIRQDYASAGNQAGNAMAKAVKDKKPLDAALVFSAEGTARLTSYLNMLQGIVPTAGGAGGKGAALGTMPDAAPAPGPGAVPATAPVPAPVPAPAQASDPFRQAVIAVLVRIAESTELMARRPGIELKPAGLK
jgi:tape measure domain-containing protein